jgi:hypothetical protein
MKKNFLTAAAVMVTALFVATTVAQAAEVTMGGELLSRYEILERNDFNDATKADSYFQSRVRLNATVKVNDSTSAYIELQSNRTWGSNFETAQTATDPAGTASAASFSPNNLDASVGVHEAYFTLQNFATLPVNLRVGRQEVILDGHRLFGDTLWTMGENSHDAIRLDHKHDNMSFAYAYIQGSEHQRADDANDTDDITAQLAYFNYAGILGGKFSLTYAFLNDGCGAAAAGNATGACNNLADDIHTIGFRQAGQLYGIDYRGEYYHQWGDATATAAAGASYTAGADIDRDAYMFGVRIGKAFNNVTMKPSLTVWYDYLSGTSGSDARNNDYKSFNTLFDTGHKFYGLADVFLNVGNNNSGSGTSGFGLQDAAIKAKISPMPGWTVKADYHWFYTAEGVAGSGTRGIAGKNDNDLGNELDITVVNAYNANTKVMIGYSNYNASSTFRGLRNQGTAGSTGSDDANWFYAQFHVKF